MTILNFKFQFWKGLDLIFFFFNQKFLWGPIICGPGPLLHWDPRPEPRRDIAEDI